MWYIIPRHRADELYHYGIKGMKWGVRRTKEQLKYDRYSIEAKVNNRLPKIKTPNGVTVNKISLHALERIESREDRRVSADEIVDALRKPLKIGSTAYDSQNRPSIQYIGEHATVNVNPSNGIITTLWKTSHKKAAKLKQKG